MAQLLRKLRRALFDSDPSFCDMYEDAHARTAAEEYLGHVRRHLREVFGDRKLDILDAGCQAGRLLIPLAEDGHRLIGVDTSGFALRRARRHAQERGLSVRLYRGDIAQVRRWVAPGSVEAVICVEVLYLCENYRGLLRLLAESVKSGGLLFGSHRPQAFYVASALAGGRADLAGELMRRSEGPTLDSAYHNWQTPQQLEKLYASVDLTLLSRSPLDHATFHLDLGLASDGRVRGLLESLPHTDSTFTIPQYWLAVAQKP